MKRRLHILVVIAVMLSGTAAAQYSFGERRGWFEDVPLTARDYNSGNAEGLAPSWDNPVGFENDVFTFLRVRRAQVGGRGGGRGGWATDLPDSDLNLSYRLQQLTAMKVDPNGRILLLTDPQLAKFPFIYMVEPGNMYLYDDEIAALRKYLLGGGFVMLDDFWGEAAWYNVEQIFARVFPERRFSELSLDHPIYRSVFRITEKGQVPNVGTGTRSEYTGITYERADAVDVHHRVITDDKGRIMVFAAHNTDYGDGWEREGNNQYYFKNFSEKHAYPLGINLLFYAMTH